MSVSLRGRYAPSPSGRMHLGNARTALLAWLQMRSRNGVLVMRIEDLDPGRSKREHEAAILADLRWLGLDWDEGPDVGGSFGPYRQSERVDSYRAALAKLEVYPCTCTRKELREVASAPHGRESVYPGTCRERPSRPEAPASLRWRVPAGVVCFDDLLLGRHCQNVAEEVGEFVVLRSDGAFAYQLAVVLDDAAMQITDVLRGEDLLDSTARQILLQNSLGLATPRYAHAPLWRGEDGEKLSKRHGVPDLTTLREAKENPDVVVATIARSLGLVSERVHAVKPRELAPDFDLQRLRENQVGVG